MAPNDPTIFVVDDDPLARHSLAAILAPLGVPIEGFPSGEDFLSRAHPSHIGCAVVDLCLGEIDGMEVLRRLRRAGCDIPVILLSGCWSVRAAVDAMEQGAFRVLEKPCCADELPRVVQDALRYQRTALARKRWRMDFAHRLESLDPRERLALELIFSGAGNKAIEHRLGVATRTVDRIRSCILRKMNALSFIELAAAYGEYRGAMDNGAQGMEAGQCHVPCQGFEL
ncbi:MAG: response regulator [Thermoguttaceae bacterium]|jgi:two-component system response regulator FixJ|nr:response regulator [Thermoguttaceae bacterium]